MIGLFLAPAYAIDPQIFGPVRKQRGDPAIEAKRRAQSTRTCIRRLTRYSRGISVQTIAHSLGRLRR